MKSSNDDWYENYIFHHFPVKLNLKSSHHSLSPSKHKCNLFSFSFPLSTKEFRVIHHQDKFFSNSYVWIRNSRHERNKKKKIMEKRTIPASDVFRNHLSSTKMLCSQLWMFFFTAYVYMRFIRVYMCRDSSQCHWPPAWIVHIVIDCTLWAHGRIQTQTRRVRFRTPSMLKWSKRAHIPTIK